ncbi:MAG: AgmX/PglI C-terminal domain-containing protein [Myxococcota bacterium]
MTNQLSSMLELSAVWGTTVLDSAVIRDARPIVVGSEPGPGVDLVLECDVFDAPRIIAELGADGRATIEPPPGATMVMGKPGASIGLGERVVLAIGPLSLVIRMISPEDLRLARAGIDPEFGRVVALTAMAHGFFVASALITPAKDMDDGASMLRSLRLGHAILLQPEKEKPLPRLTRAVAPPRREGAAGPPKNQPVAAKSPRVDPSKRKNDVAVAKSAGLLAFIGQHAAASSVFAPGVSGLNQAMNGLVGAGSADNGGAGGLGTRGIGPGGGGPGPIGIGGLRTGHPGDPSDGVGIGPHRVARLAPERTIICNNIDKEDVARVIRRNLPRFKHCYDAELNKEPDLAGKVSVRFMIGQTGGVMETAIAESSIGSQNVEACVMRVMQSLKFTAPKGGGVAVVTYPFVFASAGQ